jgi:hypothetical protein
MIKLITQNPKGVVANTVCALSSLHLAQTKILQGLDSPESSIEQSKATYFRDEAYFQIGSSRCYTEGDAVAALHLVSFSQLSSGQFPWQDAFAVLCDWLIQTALQSAENTCMIYNNMSSFSQYIVKATIVSSLHLLNESADILPKSLDIFASLMTTQSPRFLFLMKQLLGNESRFWSHENSDMQKMYMEEFAGLPNNILLAMVEINALSHWKAAESSKESLSYRELVQRGDAIEQLLCEQPFAVEEQNQPSKMQPGVDIKNEV